MIRYRVPNGRTWSRRRRAGVPRDVEVCERPPADRELIAARRLCVTRLPQPLAHLVDREIREISELRSDTEVPDAEPRRG